MQSNLKGNIEIWSVRFGILSLLGCFLFYFSLKLGDFSTSVSRGFLFAVMLAAIPLFISVFALFGMFIGSVIVDLIKFIERNLPAVKKTVSSLFSSKLLKITGFLYSPKTQREIFEPIAADWQEEYFEALSKKEVWKARWINVRYTYAFLGAMWQKSPFGDLIEFISKIAK
ncbi:MAG TPA: hypothetical protein VGB68_01765 [Pyrinomonadaceae bacterium]|jgi:xanthosine utilization system XapX-like protein